jgi:hypothetical protein
VCFRKLRRCRSIREAALRSHRGTEFSLDLRDDVTGFGCLECFVDYLLSSLSYARSQCQQETRESSFGLLAFQRLELAEARFNDLTTGGQALSWPQLSCLVSHKTRQVLVEQDAQ